MFSLAIFFTLLSLICLPQDVRTVVEKPNLEEVIIEDYVNRHGSQPSLVCSGYGEADADPDEASSSGHPTDIKAMVDVLRAHINTKEQAAVFLGMLLYMSYQEHTVRAFEESFLDSEDLERGSQRALSKFLCLFAGRNDIFDNLLAEDLYYSRPPVKDSEPVLIRAVILDGKQLFCQILSKGTGELVLNPYFDISLHVLALYSMAEGGARMLANPFLYASVLSLFLVPNVAHFIGHLLLRFAYDERYWSKAAEAGGAAINRECRIPRILAAIGKYSEHSGGFQAQLIETPAFRKLLDCVLRKREFLGYLQAPSHTVEVGGKAVKPIPKPISKPLCRTPRELKCELMMPASRCPHHQPCDMANAHGSSSPWIPVVVGSTIRFNADPPFGVCFLRIDAEGNKAYFVADEGTLLPDCHVVYLSRGAFAPGAGFQTTLEDIRRKLDYSWEMIGGDAKDSSQQQQHHPLTWYFCANYDVGYLKVLSPHHHHDIDIN